MSSTRFGILGTAALAFLGAACRPKSTESTERPAPSAATLTIADAGVVPDAAAAAERVADAPLTVVAEAQDRVRLVRAGERLLLLSGPLVYEAKPDGTLVLAASLEAFAAALPDDEALVGYVDNAVAVKWATADKEGIVAQWGAKTFRVTPDKLVAVSGAELYDAVGWKDRVVGVGPSNHLTWLAGDGPLPAWPEGAQPVITTQPTGELVIAKRSFPDGSLHVGAPGATVTKAAIPAQTKVSPDDCGFLAAADQGLYLRCWGWQSQKARVLRYAADGGWKVAFDELPDGGAGVAADGSLWVGKGREIQRCVAGGECKPVVQETLAATVDVPAYRESSEDVLQNDVYKTRLAVYLTKSKRSQPDHVEQIVPRGAGDVWAIVRNGTQRLVLHTGTAAKEHTFLHGIADARVLVRNTKPPTPWVGHCDQVFVRVGPARDAEALGKRAAEVRKVVEAAKTDSDYGLGWAVVKGRLHEHDAAGIVLWRSDVETSQAYLERVANKIVDTFAKNPVERPSAYCTLPVLDAIVATPDPGF